MTATGWDPNNDPNALHEVRLLLTKETLPDANFNPIAHNNLHNLRRL